MNSEQGILLQNQRIQAILNTIPLILRNFPPEDLRDFLLLGKFEEYHTGDVIFSENYEEFNYGWLVADGTISVFLQDVFIAKLSVGDFIGESFLFKKKPENGTLIATKPSAVLRFERDTVLQFFENRPDRFFKIFIMNLIEIQNQKLIYAGKKILHLHKKLLKNSGDTH